MGEIISQVVASKVFDMGVNMGIGTAVKILQKALGVAVDGVFGSGTLAAVNAASDALLPAYKQALAAHYQSIVAAKPAEAKFLNGWLARANS
jgi:type VI secretion system secreted protein VgrG